MATYPPRTPPVTPASPTPVTMPRVCETATQPPTRPRASTGTRSGTVALSAANIAVRAACARAQASTISGTESARASSSRPAAPSTAPASTHGTRRPRREVVRSESAPHSGLASTPTTEPIPVTRPNTSSLWPGATCSRLQREQHLHGPEHPGPQPDARQRDPQHPPPGDG